MQNATAKISKLFNWFISEGEGEGRDREKETGNGKGVIGEGETGGEKTGGLVGSKSMILVEGYAFENLVCERGE